MEVQSTEMNVSPETNKVTCPTCGNENDWVGVDMHGFGGPNSCQGTCDFDPRDEYNSFCECETALVQPFTTSWENITSGEPKIDYDIYVGGSDDSEIGDYTRVYCQFCHTVVFDQEKEEAV